MPDTRSHRGPHPEDASLFTADTQAVLAAAVGDMSWLLSRGYADPSSLKLVGDRYTLTRRQRLAVMRCACSDAQRVRRQQHCIDPEAVAGKPVLLDGYNVLITVEAALGGGVLFIARDGCVRDLASIHGTYRRVAETGPALGVIADALRDLHAGPVRWLLDRPVSNSGRLKRMIADFAGERGLDWTVRLVPNPDSDLIAAADIVATSDSNILDNAGRWLNLARRIIDGLATEQPLTLLDLSGKA